LSRQPPAIVSTMLTKVVLVSNYFFRVRIAAALALVSVSRAVALCFVFIEITKRLRFNILPCFLSLICTVLWQQIRPRGILALTKDPFHVLPPTGERHVWIYVEVHPQGQRFQRLCWIFCAQGKEGITLHARLSCLFIVTILLFFVQGILTALSRVREEDGSHFKDLIRMLLIDHLRYNDNHANPVSCSSNQLEQPIVEATKLR